MTRTMRTVANSAREAHQHCATKCTYRFFEKETKSLQARSFSQDVKEHPHHSPASSLCCQPSQEDCELSSKTTIVTVNDDTRTFDKSKQTSKHGKLSIQEQRNEYSAAVEVLAFVSPSAFGGRNRESKRTCGSIGTNSQKGMGGIVAHARQASR